MRSVFLPVGVCLAAASAYAEVPSAIAIRDAHVVTISGADLPKATVLLRDGLIQDVGAGLTLPADAYVIDGTGLTIYPGFIDGLSTWGIPSAAPTTGGSAQAAGTGQQSPAAAPAKTIHGPEDRPQTYAFTRAADLVSPTDKRLEVARAAGYTGAATYPNRGIFEGQGAMIDLAGERAEDMVVAQPIGQQVALRVGGGGFSRSFPGSLMGNIAYVRQLYLDLDHYTKAKQSYAAKTTGVRRPEYDHDLEGLADSPRLLLPADEDQQIDRMIHFGQELKVPFVLYGLHEGFKRVDELKAAGIPLLVSLKWPEKPKDADPSDIPNYRELAMRDQAPSLPAALTKAGVKFAFYSDGTESAAELKKAVKKTIDAGLSRNDAVRAMTLNVAEMYGLADRLGSIEKGKIANLVLTRGEAFEEKTTVEYVFIDGKQFRPSKELQQAPVTGNGSRRPTPSESLVGGKF